MPFAALLAALAEVPDPRRAQGQRYSMRHLLLFSVLATLAGATSYQKIIASIALQRERLNIVFSTCFRRAPAVNTLRHLFLALGRDDLEAAFRRHARDLNAHSRPEALRWSQDLGAGRAARAAAEAAPAAGPFSSAIAAGA